MSSTLFLFFVESRLLAPGWEGPLLLLFFLAAAASAPVWGKLAERYGAKPVLLSAMVLAIVAFGYAAALGPGDTTAFAMICIASATVEVSSPCSPRSAVLYGKSISLCVAAVASTSCSGASAGSCKGTDCGTGGGPARGNLLNI